MESVVALVEDERRRHRFSRVQMIRLAVGTLSHAEPDALRFCFDAVTRGTIADGARLEIVMLSGEGRCSNCRQLVPMADRFAPCPVCGGAEVRMTAGGELRVEDLEVE
jgi:hydrogenase nickel incorporation protein HypA/HybF